MSTRNIPNEYNQYFAIPYQSDVDINQEYVDIFNFFVTDIIDFSKKPKSLDKKTDLAPILNNSLLSSAI